MRWKHVQARLSMSVNTNDIQVLLTDASGNMTWRSITQLEDQGFELVSTVYDPDDTCCIGIFKKRTA